MCGFSLALMLWLQALPPTSTVDPALTIYMGDHLQPIIGEKFKIQGSPLHILISAYDWLRLKDAVQGSPDLCASAVDATSKACAEEARKVAQKARAQTVADADLIASLKRQLDSAHELTATEAEAHQRYKWATISVGAVTAVVTSIMIVQMYE
jgi:hypothetical protein